MKYKKIIAALLASMLAITGLTACGGPGEESSVPEDSSVSSEENGNSSELSGEDVSTMEDNAIRPNLSFKLKGQMNPLVSQKYSADPTSIEHNGRVYVYSTNDDQQYQTGTETNTFADINTLNVFSSDDMVNWTDHGCIDVKAAAPWIKTSWAPSIVKRVEDDGLTHFYLFYAVDGWATAVLTATDPLGPWTDPLGKPVVTPLDPVTNGTMVNCFDPGAYCEEDGTIYLACGGGVPNTLSEPMASAVFELDDDLNIVGGPYTINAPYYFESSELNKINGKYVYSYNSNREPRDTPVEGYEPSPICAIEYMTADHPTGPYTYQGYYFLNPGEAGFYWGSNHSHLQEFNDTWYMFYHTSMLEQAKGLSQGYRCVMVDEVTIHEDGSIEPFHATTTGVSQVKSLDPFAWNRAATMCSQAGITVVSSGSEAGKTIVTGIEEGDFVHVKGADFGEGADQLTVKVKGQGVIEVRLDDVNDTVIGTLEFDTEEFTDISGSVEEITGVHDVYFVFGGSDWEFDSWQFS